MSGTENTLQGLEHGCLQSSPHTFQLRDPRQATDHCEPPSLHLPSACLDVHSPPPPQSHDELKRANKSTERLGISKLKFTSHSFPGTSTCPWGRLRWLKQMPPPQPSLLSRSPRTAQGKGRAGSPTELEGRALLAAWLPLRCLSRWGSLPPLREFQGQVDRAAKSLMPLILQMIATE